MHYKLNRKNDYLFKRIFGHENNKDILARFLSVILDVTIEADELSLVKTDMSGTFLSDKGSVLDIHVQRSEFHEKMNIEMQQTYSGDIDKRILYYWAKAFSGELKKGQDYNDLPKQISILIADFNLFAWKDETKYHGIFKIREKTEDTTFCDALEIHVIELPKLRKNPLKLNALNCWLLYLDNMEGELMNQIIKAEPLIERAITIEEAFLLAEEERYNYELRERGRANYDSAMSWSLKEGIKQGMEQGMEKGIEHGLQISRGIIFNMLKKNMSLEEISDITGLSIDEVQKLI